MIENIKNIVITYGNEDGQTIYVSSGNILQIFVMIELVCK